MNKQIIIGLHHPTWMKNAVENLGKQYTFQI